MEPLQPGYHQPLAESFFLLLWQSYNHVASCPQNPTPGPGATGENTLEGPESEPASPALELGAAGVCTTPSVWARLYSRT